MKAFQFKGVIPASKSLMNRALIVQSYFPDLKLEGKSSCEDVIHLQKALKRIHTAKKFQCGDGGTTLRFLAFRASRLPGSFLLQGTRRLLQRPQAEMQEILSQLGVQVDFTPQGIRIQSDGWLNPEKPLQVKAKDSSQFLSALLLNAWDLEFDLKVRIVGKVTSESYFKMTLTLLKDLGLKIKKQGSLLVIPKRQKIRQKKYRVESDLSSLFSVASFAALSGKAEFQQFPQQSLQPDKEFLKFFKKMGVTVKAQGNTVRVHAQKNLKPIKVNLKNSPDLFPVLAVLCSFAEGNSLLWGAPQLTKKESNRIQKVADLLKAYQIPHKSRKDGMLIFGQGAWQSNKKTKFNPDHDHRMAMAAALLKSQGVPVRITDPSVVKKSFPEFWKVVGVRP